MRTLYIDLAGAERSFALVDDTHVVGSVTIDDHRAEERLMPAIDALLKDAGWNREDLTHVAAVTGPGGFMTIRVAVSLANAIAFALGIPSTGLHLSDVWHARVTSDESRVTGTMAARNSELRARDCVWLHSTKKTHAFARGFGSFEKLWPEAVLQPIGE
ncbi:MAG TPA: tRNA (adenosine(37)-N6)-threonylcarbamoyltransferase complex dimerization subunit type 1 TsaB, partial [Candidatus Peribacteria bacterium]|nr:tRNA (adenosine(37)-N6)-threonylcarbamoyltransferase complex dimerization subunit type 1 TsaB [Candidatus Peribacteria bacterium]